MEKKVKNKKSSKPKGKCLSLSGGPSTPTKSSNVPSLSTASRSSSPTRTSSNSCNSASMTCTTSTSFLPLGTESLYSTSPSKKSGSNNSSGMIAYVHGLSPLKRNKRDTMDYCSLTLQTGAEECQEALLYSKSKRSILENSQESHTPLKLQRYTFTKDNSKVIINDMTHLSSPNPMEYSFQYKKMSEVCERESQIKDILDSDGNEFENVIVCGKVIHIKEARIVGQGKYRLLTATIADNSGSIKVDIWENHIAKIQLGLVYRFSPLQVNF